MTSATRRVGSSDSMAATSTASRATTHQRSPSPIAGGHHEDVGERTRSAPGDAVPRSTSAPSSPAVASHRWAQRDGADRLAARQSLEQLLRTLGRPGWPRSPTPTGGTAPAPAPARAPRPPRRARRSRSPRRPPPRAGGARPTEPGQLVPERRRRLVGVASTAARTTAGGMRSAVKRRAVSRSAWWSSPMAMLTCPSPWLRS